MYIIYTFVYIYKHIFIIYVYIYIAHVYTCNIRRIVSADITKLFCRRVCVLYLYILYIASVFVYFSCDHLLSPQYTPPFRLALCRSFSPCSCPFFSPPSSLSLSRSLSHTLSLSLFLFLFLSLSLSFSCTSPPLNHHPLAHSLSRSLFPPLSTHTHHLFHSNILVCFHLHLLCTHVSSLKCQNTHYSPARVHDKLKPLTQTHTCLCCIYVCCVYGRPEGYTPAYALALSLPLCLSSCALPRLFLLSFAFPFLFLRAYLSLA